MTDAALDPEQFASDMNRAREYGTAVPALSTLYPDATVDDAYVIQITVLTGMIRRNDSIIGAKACTHEDQPVFGLFPRSALMGSFEVADLSQMIEPSAQPVLVFRLAKELSGASITEADVRDATETVVGGIEVTDYRLGSPDGLRPVDAIADNAGISKILIGEHGIDISRGAGLEALDCSFTLDGVDTGVGFAAGDPVASVAALANHIGSQGGSLEADWFVVVGPLRKAAPLRVGSRAELRIQGMAPMVMRAR